MRALLDTHLLLWAFGAPAKLPREVAAIILDEESDLLFSTASLWEIAIKHSLGRDDFRSEPSIIRRRLLDDLYTELPVLGEHAVAVATLPTLHKDPFDRLLVAQAIVEGVELFTVDAQLARYPGPIRVF
jgi:PIN domain nuclease of toxin-antitoxin system